MSFDPGSDKDRRQQKRKDTFFHFGYLLFVVVYEEVFASVGFDCLLRMTGCRGALRTAR